MSHWRLVLLFTFLFHVFKRFYGEPYSFVMFEVSIQRKFYYHLINILLPCTLMSGLILLVFKLPAESGEKTGLGITILLSFSVFLLMIAETLPKTSDSLPIIGFYVTFLLVASSSSLLITIISLNMHHASGEHGVPAWVRRVLRVLAAITLTRQPKFTSIHSSTISRLVQSTGPRRRLSTRRGAGGGGGGGGGGGVGKLRDSAAFSTFPSPSLSINCPAPPDRTSSVSLFANAANVRSSPYFVNYSTSSSIDRHNAKASNDGDGTMKQRKLLAQVFLQFVVFNY